MHGWISWFDFLRTPLCNYFERKPILAKLILVSIFWHWTFIISIYLFNRTFDQLICPYMFWNICINSFILVKGQSTRIPWHSPLQARAHIWECNDLENLQMSNTWFLSPVRFQNCQKICFISEIFSDILYLSWQAFTTRRWGQICISNFVYIWNKINVRFLLNLVIGFLIIPAQDNTLSCCPTIYYSVVVCLYFRIVYLIIYPPPLPIIVHLIVHFYNINRPCKMDWSEQCDRVYKFYIDIRLNFSPNSPIKKLYLLQFW